MKKRNPKMGLARVAEAVRTKEFVDGRYTILGDDKLTYVHIDASRVGKN